MLTRIELQEIKQRVTAMLSEFEAAEAAEAVEALSCSTDDLMPGEKVEADEHLQGGAHFEVTRTLMAATKRRLGTVLGEVSDTADRQLTALGRLDAWFNKASEGNDDSPMRTLRSRGGGRSARGGWRRRRRRCGA